MKHKRPIAFLLCVMMLVSLLPAAVFADEADDEAIVEVAFEEIAEEPAEETVEEPEENDAASEAEETVADGEAVEDEEIIEEDEIVEDEQPAEDEEPVEDEIPEGGSKLEEDDEDEIPEEPEVELPELFDAGQMLTYNASGNASYVQALIEYITLYGKADSKGNPYISTTYFENDIRNFVELTYNSSDNTIEFSNLATYESSTILTYFYLNVSNPSYTYVVDSKLSFVMTFSGSSNSTIMAYATNFTTNYTTSWSPAGTVLMKPSGVTNSKIAELMSTEAKVLLLYTERLMNGKVGAILPDFGFVVSSTNLTHGMYLFVPSNGSTGIGLKWTSNPNAYSYVVYRRNTGASSWQKTYTAYGSTLTVKDVAAGQSYEFAVEARNSSGTRIAFSNIVKITPQIYSYEAPVLQTPANHENFMIIQWSTVYGASGYRVQYREGNGAWTEVKVPLTSVNSKGEPRWDYKNAKDGATYTFRVFADFIDGTTTESNRMGQMRLRTPKIKVSHFGGSDLGGGFRIDWEATNGGSQYKIYYREKGTSAWTLYTMMPKSSNTTFCNIKASVISANPNMPNLVAGHTYEFMVLTCTTVASVTSGYPTPFVSMKF